MGHFSSPESDGDFELVATLQKLPSVFEFDFIIVDICLGSKFDLFDIDDALFFTGLGIFFLLFIHQATVVAQLTNGRVGIGGYFDEIHSPLLGQFYGIWR